MPPSSPRDELGTWRQNINDDSAPRGPLLRAADRRGARSRVLASFVLELAPRLVRFVSQVEEDVEELFLLADEEPVIHKALNRSDGAVEFC
jgi:hypothetical protein